MQFKSNIRELTGNRRLKLTDSELERRDKQIEQQAQYLVSWEELTMIRAHVSAVSGLGTMLSGSGLCRMQNLFRPILRRSGDQI